MEISKILSADLNDIVFDGRNKLYGAYNLRKTYPRRLEEALLITVALSMAIIGVPRLFVKSPLSETQLLVKDVSLEDLKQPEEKKAELPPPPPPPKQEIPKVEISKFTPPIIVKDAQVKEDDEIKEVSKLADTKIGTINQEGAKDEGVVTAPPVEVRGTAVIAAPKEQAEDYDKVYTVVEIPAEFPGGKEAWQKYLERNLNSTLPVDNGAPAGRYVVTLSFIVDKNGSISNVQAENDPGYGTREEAIRVVKKGPNWKPAVQNGRNVTYRHIQNIVFVVAEQQ
jgi:protein TonB